MSRDTKKWSSGFLIRSDTNQPVQPQNIARNLKIQIKEEEELYYPTIHVLSKNKKNVKIFQLKIFSF